MEIEKPIIIIGTGRCGSTLLHRLLARHDDVGWLSTFNEVFPRQAWLSYFSKLYRTKFISHKIKHLPFFPKPFEAYKFWEYYLPRFSRRDKPLTANDVPEEAIAPIRDVVSKILKYQKKKRLLIKVTGWARIAYFLEIFPDALFVFLNREPRSIVSSWIQAGWLDVTSSPESEAWQWGKVPPGYLELWKKFGATSILSAALKIRLDLDDIYENMAQFNNRCYELEYEDLVSEPQRSLQNLVHFCELKWNDKFESIIRTMSFYNNTNKWKKYLTEQEGDLIIQFLSQARAISVAANMKANPPK